MSKIFIIITIFLSMVVFPPVYETYKNSYIFKVIIHDDISFIGVVANISIIFAIINYMSSFSKYLNSQNMIIIKAIAGIKNIIEDHDIDDVDLIVFKLTNNRKKYEYKCTPGNMVAYKLYSIVLAKIMNYPKDFIDEFVMNSIKPTNSVIYEKFKNRYKNYQNDDIHIFLNKILHDVYKDIINAEQTNNFINKINNSVYNILKE